MWQVLQLEVRLLEASAAALAEKCDSCSNYAAEADALTEDLAEKRAELRTLRELAALQQEVRMPYILV